MEFDRLERDAGMTFEMLAIDGTARRGRLTTAHGTVETPVFMPCGTYGTVKGMTPRMLTEVGTQILLGNTFHLMLRPGDQAVRALGGLHEFMQWPGPILTDSGGYQVFSLRDLREVSEHGVAFRSPINGDAVELTPERSIEVQHNLGSDIVMSFDECTPYPATVAEAEASMRLSMAWARLGRERHSAGSQHGGSLLFGIVQGGMYPHLRSESLAELVAIGFDGYAIGGLSVGEPQSRDGRGARPRRPGHAGARAALPHGGGYAGRPVARRDARHRHVRLRAADAQCAQRLPVHLPRRGEDPQRRTPVGSSAGR